MSLKYYSAWFCPFANRTTLALEHHGLAYEWIEALGWERRAASGEENLQAGSRSEWWYHWKHPELLQVNPDGMVPTLTLGNKVATESITCMRLIDELARSQGSPKCLVPQDPWERAHHQNWAVRVNKTCSAYYSVLVKDEGFDQLVSGLEDFAQHAGPYFGGRDEPGIVDLTLFPYAARFYVLELKNRKIPEIPAYDAWLQRLMDDPVLAATLPDRDRYLHHIEKYASGKARSKVANAVRRGVAAHDYDHSKDGA